MILSPGSTAPSRPLNDALRTLIRVPLDQSPTFYFNLAVGAKQDAGNGEAGIQVWKIPDLSGNGHHALQTTDAKQGTLGVDADGNTEIAVDGTADWYLISKSLDPYVAPGTATSHSFWFEFDADGASGDTEHLADGIYTDRIIVSHLTPTAGKCGFYSTGPGWQAVAAAAAGEQSLEFHLDTTASLGLIYRTGKYIGSGSYTGQTFQVNMSLGARWDGLAGYFDGSFQEAWMRRSLQSVAEQFASRQYRATRYPTRWASTLPLVVPVATSATAGAWFDTRDAANFVLDGTDVIVAKDCSRDVDDPVSNGTFDTDTVWTKIGNFTISGGKGHATNATNAHALYQGVLTLGQRYLLEFDLSTVTLGNCFAYLGSTTVLVSNVNGDKHVVGNCAGVPNCTLGGQVGGSTFDVDNVVVTPGNHGYQATSANRPTYDAVNKCTTSVAANSEFLDWGIAPPAAGVTFSAWVNMTSLAAAYSLWGSIDAAGKACYVQVQTNGKVRAVCGTGGGNATFDSTATLTAGVWSHVAVTISTTGITITIDGTVATSGAFTETLSTKGTYLHAHNNNGAAANHANASLSHPAQRPYIATAAMISYLDGLGRT